MDIIYNLSIRIYWLAIKFSSLFHPKAKLWIDGRKNWYFNLKKQINPKDKWIWVHCSSHGEFEDFSEVVSEIRNTYSSSHKILLTFFSPSGMKAMGNQDIADLIIYMPLDTRCNAQNFLNLINPKLILFSKSELWYNFLTEIGNRGIPIFLISAIVGWTSKFIKWPQNKLYKKCFLIFTQIYCQNLQTKNILSKKFNITTGLVTGNSRIDRVQKFLYDKEYPSVRKFVSDSFCVIVGSCTEKEEPMIFYAINRLKHFDIKWIIVPHEINEKKINDKIAKQKTTFLKYSNLSSMSPDHKLLFIDFVGALKHLYKYGNMAIVGGGFNKKGIHNLIEPAFYGVPSAFGPNHRDYPEALGLLSLGYSSIYFNKKGLKKVIEYYYNNPISSEMKDEIKQSVFSGIGATKLIISDIKQRSRTLV